MFFCQQPAYRGGQTPIASVRFFQRVLSSEVWNTFVEKGVRTKRLLSAKNETGRKGALRKWNAVFMTESREAAERIMADLGWRYEWIPEADFSERKRVLGTEAGYQHGTLVKYRDS